MNTVAEKPVTTLSLPQRAAVALGTVEHEVKLRELVASSADIVAVVNAAGREQAHRIGMSLKTARVNIEKAGKLAREDATAFSKAVIAEEARLVNIVEPEEDRVIGLRDGWDESEQARKDALIAAERARVDRIEGLIDAIKAIPSKNVSSGSDALSDVILACASMAITKVEFEDFHDKACADMDDTMAALESMLVSAVHREAAALAAEQARIAEAARIEAERAELAELRAAAAKVAAEQAAEAKRLADLAAAQEAEARCQREHAAAEHQAQLDAIHAAGQKVLAQQAAADARDRQAVIDAAHSEGLDDNALIDSAIAASARFAEVLAEQLQEEAAFNADDLARCTATAAECMADGRAGIDALTDAADSSPDIARNALLIAIDALRNISAFTGSPAVRLCEFADAAMDEIAALYAVAPIDIPRAIIAAHQDRAA